MLSMFDEASSNLNIRDTKLNPIITKDRKLDSFGSSDLFHECKRAKHNNYENASTNNNMVKFKGVVPQQNGHYGAQIYANHQRIWLGTFKSEEEAAMAYDSAAIKLRSGDSHRNFSWTERSIQEPYFQNHYSTVAILGMIRDGSYQTKFANFLRARKVQRDHLIGHPSLNQRRVINGNDQFSCVQLFQKELTPSDVGKLNRLVIPKKFAVKYFPYINENEHDHDMNRAALDVDMELVLYDRLMKAWSFRYSYWRSSQSFVFTKGWNKFVKEKKVKEKDTVTFYTCVCPTHLVQLNEGQQQFSLIDIVYHYNEGGHGSCNNVVDEIKRIEEMQKELEINLSERITKIRLQKEQKELNEENVLERLAPKEHAKELKIFGVRIQ